MATKKHVPVKVATKPAAKKIATAVKPVPKKTASKVKPAPVKKVAPKKAAITAAPERVIKPVNKKPPVKVIAKKAAIKAPVKQPVKKTVTKPVLKKAPLKTTAPIKSVAETAPPKAAANKKVQPVAKNNVAKPNAVINNTLKAVNPAQKIMAKKEVIKTPAASAATEKAGSAKPAAEVKAKDIKVPTPKPVVIPKIATKTVRKYQPDFTKSVLDKTQRDPGAPSQRYSDAELQEFRELIQRKLEAAKKELSYLHGLITRKDEMGGDEGDNRYMTMEDGSLSMEREQLSQMASRQITFIDHLEKAVMRIENKTYGICRVTGKLIDKARLRAVPHATLSIEAKMSSGR